MELDDARRDRVRGVLVGQACGDALGVPYEFARPPGPGEPARMTGGGLGDLAPGEWSDDTAMAVAIADVVASGADLRTSAALDEVAEGFLRWYAADPPDVGIQTREVLATTGRHLAAGAAEQVSSVMTAAAAAYSLDNERSAGNGALMRTSPVALGYLDDRDGGAEAARSVARLTHADPLAGDSCVLWSEAIRIAVTQGRFDVASGLDLLPESRRDSWNGWVRDAAAGPAHQFTPNRFTVTALQAAWSAIVATPEPAGEQAPQQLQDALHAVIRIGDDTDTIAAIAGGLLGARWGASAVPAEWVDLVHGWPGRTGEDLLDLQDRVHAGLIKTGLITTGLVNTRLVNKGLGR